MKNELKKAKKDLKNSLEKLERDIERFKERIYSRQWLKQEEEMLRLEANIMEWELARQKRELVILEWLIGMIEPVAPVMCKVDGDMAKAKIDVIRDLPNVIMSNEIGAYRGEQRMENGKIG